MDHNDKEKRLQVATQLLSGMLANRNYDPPRRAKKLYMIADALAFADELIAFVETERNLDEFN